MRDGNDPPGGTEVEGRGIEHDEKPETDGDRGYPEGHYHEQFGETRESARWSGSGDRGCEGQAEHHGDRGGRGGDLERCSERVQPRTRGADGGLGEVGVAGRVVRERSPDQVQEWKSDEQECGAQRGREYE